MPAIFRPFSLFQPFRVSPLGDAGGVPAVTKYYIDATSGNDSSDGLSTATPWKTIAKVNASTFEPGNQILFKRGETWREQLTVPSSGAEGNPIVFGAYGTGEKPIISGADSVTLAPVSGSSIVGDTTSGGTTALSSSHLYFFKITSQVSGALTSYHVWCGALSGNIVVALYTDVGGVPAAKIDGSDSVSTPFNANNWVVVTPSSNIDIVSGTSYWMAVQATTNYTSSVVGGSGGGVRIHTNNAFGTFPGTPSIIGSGDASLFHKYITINSTIDDVYYGSVSTEPGIIIFSEAIGHKKAEINSLTVNGDWCYSGGVVYVFNDSESADLTVEVAARTHCVRVDYDHIVVRDIETYGANGLASIFFGSTSGSSVYQCNTHHNYYHGIYYYNVAVGEITGCVASDCWDGNQYGSSITFAHGIQVYGAESSDITIHGNLVERNYCGIWVGNGAKDVSVTYNIVAENKVNGIDIFQNNVASNPTRVFNNVVIHNPTHPDGHGHGIDIQQSVANGIVVKNNIISSSRTGPHENNQLLCLAMNTQSTAETDYNCFHLHGGSTTDVGKLGSTVYATFAEWRAALDASAVIGKDTNSFFDDPLFTDAANGDFTLQPSSPCINAGTDVGLTTDYAGNPIIGAPDIGAYEYQE